MGVTIKLYKCITRVLKATSQVLQGCFQVYYKIVTRLLQGHYVGVSRVDRGVTKKGNGIIQTGNGIISPTFRPLIKNLLQNVFHFY